MEGIKKGRGRPAASLDENIVKALDVLRGLNPFRVDDVDRLRAIHFICSKPGGIDAILNKRYKKKPLSKDEQQAFDDRRRIKQYYHLHPEAYDKELQEWGFSSLEDYHEKHTIVHDHPYFPPGSDWNVEDAVDAAFEWQGPVGAFSEFLSQIEQGHVPFSDVAKITRWHFDNQQEGSPGKSFAQRLYKAGIRLDESNGKNSGSLIEGVSGIEKW
jgi:hypothetical protein